MLFQSKYLLRSALGHGVATSQLGLLLGFLLLGGIACGDGLPFEPAGPASAPDPGEAGPFQVGVRTLWLEDSTRKDPRTGVGPRRFRVEVWYPATQDTAGQPLDQVDILGEAPEALKDRLTGISMPLIEEPAVRDAALDSKHGPYPVIVFSHGNGGIRTQSASYTAHLASHGYLVFSPDHVGNLLYDFIDNSTPADSAMDSIFQRPDDVRLVLDRITAGDWSADGALEAAADLNKIGITGHSLGGLTTLYMTQPEGDGYDKRFLAAVPITPATTIMTLLAAPVEGVSVPVLYIGATTDQTLDYQAETLDAYDLNVVDKAMAGVKLAGHFSFTEICELNLAGVASALGMSSDVAGLLDDGCGSQNIPIPRAHALMNRYGAAWFNTYLRDSELSASTYLELSQAPTDLEYQVSR